MAQELTVENIRELLDYDPETGFFYHKKRAREWFKTEPAMKICNTRFAGKKAGALNAYGYVQICLLSKLYPAGYLAKAILDNKLPKGQIDHINHIRDDNRAVNLRVVSIQENLQNQSRRKNNTSGCTGVSWIKKNEKWRAYIRVNYSYIHLYSGDSYAEAVAARKAAEIKYGFHKNHGKLLPNK